MFNSIFKDAFAEALKNVIDTVEIPGRKSGFGYVFQFSKMPSMILLSFPGKKGGFGYAYFDFLDAVVLKLKNDNDTVEFPAIASLLL
jgi:hypothetical protein